MPGFRVHPGFPSFVSTVDLILPTSAASKSRRVIVCVLPFNYQFSRCWVDRLIPLCCCSTAGLSVRAFDCWHPCLMCDCSLTSLMPKLYDHSLTFVKPLFKKYFPSVLCRCLEYIGITTIQGNEKFLPPAKI